MNKNKAQAIKAKIDSILASKQAEVDALAAKVNDLTGQLEEANNQPKSRGIEMRLPEMIRLETPEEVTKAIDEIKDGLKKHAETLEALLIVAKSGNAKEFPKEIKVSNINELLKGLKINNFPEIQKVEVVEDKTKQKAMPSWVPEVFTGFFETLAGLMMNTVGKTIELSKKVIWKTEVQQSLPFMVMILDPKTGKPVTPATYVNNSFYGGSQQGGAAGGNVGVLDGAGARINPMSNEKGDEIVTAIGNIVVPAPVGGATEAKQDTGNASLVAIDANTDRIPNDPMTDTKGQAIVDAINGITIPAPVGGATEAKQDAEIDAISNKDIFLTLKDLIKSITYPAWLDRSANAIRNQVQSGTITTVTTVTTVTGITNLDGYQAKLQVINQNNGAWAQVVRARIS